MSADDIECRICGHATSKVFEGELLGRTVSYYDCDSCGYVQTEEPFWLAEAYESSINLSDTGILQRNIRNANIVLVTLWLMRHLKSRVVDCAGGYGILVRLLRDAGVDAYWHDPYTKNLLAQGFEYKNESPAVLVTAFEAFEHFVDPQEELDRLLKIAPNVLISTELIPEPTPAQDAWWYYGKEHGQHIGFFRLKTLQKMADVRGLYLVSDGRSFHMFTRAAVAPSLWKFGLKLKRLLAPLIKLPLCSRTQSDHDVAKS